MPSSRTICPAGVRTVCEADAGMKAAQCREDVEEESESGIDAGCMSEIGGNLEQVGQAAAGNELGHHRKAARVALIGSWPCEALVLETAQARHAVAENPFERRELRTEHEAL